MNLLEMLAYKRPEGSPTQKLFCDKYLKPLMGDPDRHGNYIKVVGHINGGLPQICFTAHHDTVHNSDGMQKIHIAGDRVTTVDGNCLGADCTTGVWIILHMIKAGVPGAYVIHSGEEVGCVGSSNFVADCNEDFSPHTWFPYLKAVISFDRKGQESIITHQLGQRTCSDEFAVSLSKVLGMPSLRPDPTGAYTDSNEYIYNVGECTNISVGYLAQHTKNESQDLYFAHLLLNNLIAADWSKLEFFKEPEVYESRTNWGRGGWSNLDDWSYPYEVGNRKQTSNDKYFVERMNMNSRDIYDLIQDYPVEIAETLDKLGVDATYLLEQMELLIYGDVRGPY